MHVGYDGIKPARSFKAVLWSELHSPCAAPLRYNFVEYTTRKANGENCFKPKNYKDYSNWIYGPLLSHGPIHKYN